MSPLLVVALPPGLRLAAAATRGLARRARQWPVDSQHAARRNAMVACTAAAARRRERDEVEDYLLALAAERRDATAHG